MDEARVARIRSWLTDPRVRSHDASAVDALAAALTSHCQAAALLSVGRHGTTTCFSSRPYPGPRRRALEFDPAGNLVAALRWEADGALSSAAIRTARGEWIGVEPRATSHPAWGLSDRLWRLGEPPDWQRLEPLTAFEALDWTSIDHIPPLAEPARLPPGTGTAVLNLIAALAMDHGRAALRYHGPYATEQLFTALLESFHPISEGDPLRNFLEERLPWRPAPHERHFPRSDLCLQLRGRIEKVVWRGRVYYRPDWPPVTRRTAYAVREVGGRVRCSLCALGTVVEDHLILEPSGPVVATLPSLPDPRLALPVDQRIRAGLSAVVRASSAPALARSIDAVMGPLTLEWAGRAGDLVEIEDDRVSFAWRLADVGAARIRAAPTGRERLGRALELLTEMAHLVGDALRSQAQAALAASPVEVQRAAFGEPIGAERVAPGDSKGQAEAAARILAATQALAEMLG